MRKNTITYSALRSAEQKNDINFYEELSYKTLVTIAQLTDHDISKEVKLLTIKEKMGINFAALAKIADNLKHQGNIALSLSKDTIASDNLGPENVCVKLTNEGLNEILKRLNTQPN